MERDNGKVTVEVTEDMIMIRDKHGEIVSWHIDEWTEQPDVATTAATAIVIALTDGPEELRKTVGKEVKECQEKKTRKRNSDHTRKK